MIMATMIALDFAVYSLREGYEAVPLLALMVLFGILTLYLYSTEDI